MCAARSVTDSFSPVCGPTPPFPISQSLAQARSGRSIVSSSPFTRPSLPEPVRGPSGCVAATNPFDRGMTLTIQQEAAERKIDLSDDPPAAVEALIHYMYNLDYNEQLGSTHAGTSPLMLHVHTCVIADKYDVKPLKNLAVSKFNLTTIDKGSTPEFSQAALQAYKASQATRPICDAIVAYAIKHDLLASDNGATSTFSRALRESAGLAADVAERLYARVGSSGAHDTVEEGEKRYKCAGGCGQSQIMNLDDCTISTFICYWCNESFTATCWRRFNGYGRMMSK